MKILIIIVAVIITACSYQTNNAGKQEINCKKYYDPKLKTDVYKTADEWPEFPGGSIEMTQFIHMNFKHPNQEDIQTKVYCSFIINKNGSVSDLQILNKYNEEHAPINREDYTLVDKEILRVIALMPKWQPAKCNGKKVTFIYKLPINIYPQ